VMFLYVDRIFTTRKCFFSNQIQWPKVVSYYNDQFWFQFTK